MNCPNCGKSADSAFCPDCGTPLQAAHSAPSTSPASEPSGEDGVNLFQIIPGWIWATAAILILVVVLFARGVGPSGGGSGTSTGSSGSPTRPPSSSSASSTIPSVKKYPAGMYKVGTDIPAGLYVLTAGTSYSGYYKVTSDSSGSFDSILYNENFNGRCYLELKNGQYVELTRCTAISFDDAEPLSPTGGTLSGDWLKVGFDIAPGEYKITAVSGTGYCAVYSHATTDFANIVTNDNFTGSKYITVKAGQYLQLSRCELTVQ